MSFAEAQYAINEILKGAKASTGVSGLAPGHWEWFLTPDRDAFHVNFTPVDMILQDQLVCRTGGVTICIKQESAPQSVDDYEQRVDRTRDQLTLKTINRVTFTNIRTDAPYYVRVFPYSDHGVYNFDDYYIGTVGAKAYWIYGFHQDFTDLNPATSITYIAENKDFKPMTTDLTEGTVDYGSWGNWEVIAKNLPYMVRTDGTVDYQLDPEDYSKKLDGTPSDVSNADYDGGAFAWLPTVYMHEEYDADGNGRTVRFSNTNEVDETKEFYKLKWCDKEGIWISCFMANADMKSLQNKKRFMQESTNLAAPTSQNIDNYINVFKFIDDNYNDTNYRIFGGPIFNYIRDLLFLLYKNVDIKKSSGYISGSYWVSGDSLATICGKGGRFHGENADTKQISKIFHSIIFSMYSQGLLDGCLFARGKFGRPDEYSDAKTLSGYGYILLKKGSSYRFGRGRRIESDGDRLDTGFVLIDSSNIYRDNPSGDEYSAITADSINAAGFKLGSYGYMKTFAPTPINTSIKTNGSVGIWGIEGAQDLSSETGLCSYSMSFSDFYMYLGGHGNYNSFNSMVKTYLHSVRFRSFEHAYNSTQGRKTDTYGFNSITCSSRFTGRGNSQPLIGTMILVDSGFEP